MKDKIKKWARDRWLWLVTAGALLLSALVVLLRRDKPREDLEDIHRNQGGVDANLERVEALERESESLKEIELDLKEDLEEIREETSELEPSEMEEAFNKEIRKWRQ